MESALAARRQAAGLTQAALAGRAGVSRQALIALEAGRSAPSMALGLRLAQVLGCRVESLFWLPETPVGLSAVWAGEAEARTAGAADGGAAVSPGGRALVGRVGDAWIAHPLPPASPGALRVSADAVLHQVSRHEAGRAQAELALLRPVAELEGALLCAGCAPALGLLAARLATGNPGLRMHWLEHGSAAALDLLAAGHVHVAGSHLLDESTGEYNLPELRRRLVGGGFDVFTLTRWEVGLVVSSGNPRGLRGIRDLPGAIGGVVAREAGSGADRLLRHLLQRADVPVSAVPFVPRAARGHLEAARQVAEGRGEACLAIRAAALAWGLDFVPLAEERFDLVLPTTLATDPRIVRMLDTLASRSFRRELESLGGHFTDGAAAHVGRLEAA